MFYDSALKQPVKVTGDIRHATGASRLFLLNKELSGVIP